jgi:hypothetical protein
MRSRRTAAIALVVLILLLLLGTQMPGAWRDQALQSTHLPWQVNPLAHFTAFAAMAWLASAPPLRWPLARVLGRWLWRCCPRACNTCRRPPPHLARRGH